MKHYYFTFEVPDDFDPEKLEINAAYPEEVSLVSEGFNIEDDILAKLKVEQIDPKDTSVVLFRFPKELVVSDPAVLEYIKALLEQSCNCTVVGLINDIEVLVQNSAEAIQMLRGMIDKNNSKSIIIT